jgi:hypothetical protein
MAVVITDPVMSYFETDFHRVVFGCAAQKPAYTMVQIGTACRIINCEQFAPVLLSHKVLSSDLSVKYILYGVMSISSACSVPSMLYH